MATSKHGVQLASPAAMIAVYSASVIVAGTPVWIGLAWLVESVIR